MRLFEHSFRGNPVPNELPQLTKSSPSPPPRSAAFEITYADERTDRDRRDELSPDLVEARTAGNAIGTGFLVVGVAFVQFLRIDRPSWVVLALVATAYLLPGGTLLLAGRMITRRRRAGVVVATAAGCWVMLAMATLATAELVALLTTSRPIGSPWFRVLIHLLFLASRPNWRSTLSGQPYLRGGRRTPASRPG
jgi:hypothetical protein